MRSYFEWRAKTALTRLIKEEGNDVEAILQAGMDKLQGDPSGETVNRVLNGPQGEQLIDFVIAQIKRLGLTATRPNLIAAQFVKGAQQVQQAPQAAPQQAPADDFDYSAYAQRAVANTNKNYDVSRSTSGAAPTYHASRNHAASQQKNVAPSGGWTWDSIEGSIKNNMMYGNLGTDDLVQKANIVLAKDMDSLVQKGVITPDRVKSGPAEADRSGPGVYFYKGSDGRWRYRIIQKRV